jgi:hypothetical protein
MIDIVVIDGIKMKFNRLEPTLGWRIWTIAYKVHVRAWTRHRTRIEYTVPLYQPLREGISACRATDDFGRCEKERISGEFC